MKTYMAKAETVERKWYVVDAAGVPLGRLASKVAAILRGKNKPTFTPNVDTGDFVIVLNTDKVVNTEKKLEDKFQSVYDAYCMRLRVMYISGDYNILTALITCKDVSSFFTRYEMIKSVSKSDTELLKEVNDKTKEIVTKKDGLDEKLREYTNIKSKHDEQKALLVAKQKKIESNSEEIAAQKISLATDRAESDSLLAKLTAQNQQYTEFRNSERGFYHEKDL